jgi:predicted 3-demethylubiquinone-9 3-methyltransferase (glyoxalase superfamily)
MANKPKVRTCLWFDGNGQEAAEFYVSLLPDSSIETAGGVVVELSLAGTPYMFLNGGPQHKLSPAASIAVRTADQAETDQLWDALVADGGQESMCGWLTDRFGVSWQIVPDALPRMLGADDREAADRAMQAMLKMKRIDIALLETAFLGQ